MVKDPVKRIKRQATNWEEISANNLFENVLISEICKNPQNNGKRCQTIQLGSEQPFHQRGHTDGKQACEKKFNTISYQGKVN